MKKRILEIIWVWIVTCMMTLTGCGLLPKEEELPMAPLLLEGETEDYVVSQVVRGDVVIQEQIRASYVPSSTEKLGFELGDEKISKVYVSVGDSIKAGDVLMELDVSSLDEQIRQQQNQIDDLYMSLNHLYQNEGVSISQAQLQDKQAAENSQAGWVSRVDEVVDTYASQAQQLKNSIQVAEQRLKELEEKKKTRQIIASIDGVVTYLYEFQEGERSVKDKKVVTLSDMSEAMFEVYSENGSLLQAGETYTLTSEGNEYQVVAHRAEELSFDGLKSDAMYLTMTTPDPSLEQGAAGTIVLIMEESRNTIYVPNSAVKNLRGETVVYCIDEQGFREIRPVQIGIQTGKITEITQGLEEGEVVIIE